MKKFYGLIYFFNALVAFVPFAIILINKSHNISVNIPKWLIPIILLVILILGFILRFVTFLESHYGAFQWAYYKFTLGTMVSITLLFGSYYYNILEFDKSADLIAIYVVIFSGVILTGDSIKEMVEIIKVKDKHSTGKTKTIKKHLFELFFYIVISILLFVLFNLFIMFYLRDTLPLEWIVSCGVFTLLLVLIAMYLSGRILKNLQNS